MPEEVSSSDIPESVKQKIAAETARKFNSRNGLIFLINYLRLRVFNPRNLEAITNVLIAYVILLFIFLGYMANTLLRAANDQLLFIWRYFNPLSWINTPDSITPFFAYGITFLLLGYTEKVFFYATRKSLFLVTFLIATALIFHQMIHVNTITFIMYFASWEGYVNIVVLLAIGIFFAWVGSQLRLFVYRRKKKEIDYLSRLDSIDKNQIST